MSTNHPNETIQTAYGLENRDTGRDVVRRSLEATQDREARRKAHRRGTGIRVAALSGAALLGGLFDHVALQPDARPAPSHAVSAKPKDSASGQGDYLVQPGDNPWVIAAKIQRNTGDSGDIRPIVDEIQHEAAKDGNYELQVGEHIDVTAKADVNPDVPGVQLDPK